MKPRIIVILNRLIVGGQTHDTLPLLHCLKKDFDILVLYGKKEKDEIDESNLLNEYSLKGKYISYLRRSINPANDFIAFLKIRRSIRKYKPHIVHTHGAKPGFLGRLAAHYLKVPCIIHTYHGHLFHSYYNNFFTSILKQIERRLAMLTTAIVAISKTQAFELTETYKVVPHKKINIIPLGIDVNTMHDEENLQRLQFRKKYNVLDDEIIIAVIGRIAPIKNLELFVHIASILLKQKISGLRFFIIGDGFLKNSIKDACNKWNLTWSEGADDNTVDFVFTSWIKNVVPALFSIDILALTSNNEGTPMSIIEAQYCGKPVVATNVGGVPDTLIDGATGFLVEPNNAHAMAEKLKILIQDNGLRQEMGIKARAFATEKFAKKTEVENYRGLYNSLLTRKNILHSTKQDAMI